MRQTGGHGKLRYVCAVCLCIVGAGSFGWAGEFRLESLAVRGGFSGISPLEEEQKYYFQQADLVLAARLPWEWDLGTSWVVGTRLLTSGGVLHAAQETNGIFTLVPLDIVIGRKDGLLSFDMGFGGALLIDHKYGIQNFGGPFQFVWTFGATSRFLGPLGLGYHFQHYSDAMIYGHHTRGADLHLFELIYWFKTGR
ncbi:MAG: conserved protein of unknown function [Nitrospira sp.]